MKHCYVWSICVPLALLLSGCSSGEAQDDFASFSTFPTTTASTTQGSMEGTGDGDGDMPGPEAGGDGDGDPDPTTGGAECGNGVSEGEEQCDGADLGGTTCESLGYEGGTLACGPDCILDASGCDFGGAVCGDGQINGVEECDGNNLGGQNCTDFGFTGGALSCNVNCTLDLSGCTDDGNQSCGNGQLDGGEQCDGDNLGGSTCVLLGYAGGALNCNPNCTLDPSECIPLGPQCGDNMAEGGEQCDGNDLDGQTCMSLGFDMGQLACDQNCGFDTSGCSNQGGGFCGDNILDPGEDCDTNNLGGETCQTQGFDAGVLACAFDCSFDTSMCMDGGGGDDCNTDNDCPIFWNCVDNLCWEGNEGDPCVFDSDCVNGNYCQDQTCWDGSIGDPCTFDQECETDICLIVQDTCSAGAPGDPCTFGSECMNDCQNNTCT